MNFSFRKVSSLFAAFFVFLITGVFAQSPEWLSYTNGKAINDLAVEGNNVWIATSMGGLVKLNGTTGAFTFYNRTNSGLKSNTILSACVDSAGNKWLGTYYGLMKFNGTSWTLFNKAGSGIPSDTVLNTVVDRYGRKWVLTQHAFAMFNDTTWTVYNAGPGTLHSANLYCIGADPVGKIWVGGDNGLDVFDGTNWVWYTPFNSGIPSLKVNCITFQSNGKPLIGTKDKGAAFQTDTLWTTYNNSNSPLPGNQVNDVKIDSLGNMWFATQSGLSKKGLNWSIYFTSNSSLPSNVVTSLAPAYNSTMWVGTNNNLARIDTMWTIYNPSSYGIPENTLEFATVDQLGTRWFISSFSGVYSWDANNWTGFKYSSVGLPSNNVNFIASDVNNNKWFCTDSGLGKYDGTNWTVYKRRNSNIPSDSILCAVSDGTNLWIGTAGYGAAKFNGTTFTKYSTTNSGISDDYITWISIDKNGNKWFGTQSGGVSMFDGTNWNVYNTTNSGLPGNYINNIAFENNKKWFSTKSGLAVFNDTTWATYTTGNSSLPENTVNAVAVDQSGVKWLAMPTTGLVKLSGTTFTVYNTGNSPIPANGLSWLFADPSGNIWMTTANSGLAVYHFAGILPSIATGPVGGPYCVDNALNVPVYAFGSSSFVPFNSSNVFTAVISDGTGNFSAAANIGFLPSAVSVTIVSRLPKTLTYGNAYRIKVVGSTPAVSGTDNGSNFTVYESPKPVIKGRTATCEGGLEVYTTSAPSGVSYQWSVKGGTISGRSTDTILTVIWGAKGVGSLTLTQKTPAGCLDSTVQQVNISSRPPKTIKGDTNVCANRYEVYSTLEDASLTNQWVITGGTITAQPAFNNVLVLWGPAGTGKVKLIQTTAAGCVDSATITIHKYVAPNTNFSGADSVKYATTKTYSTPPPGSGINNKWYVTGGTISGSSTGNSVNIVWGNGPAGNVKLVQKTASGCTDSSEMDVFIYEPVIVSGNNFVCENLPQDYYSTSNLLANCQWYVTGGTPAGATNTKILVVNWGAAGSGKVKLVQTYANGYKDSLSMNIQINYKPPKPKITEKNSTLTSDVPVGNQWFYNGIKIDGATSQTYFTNERSGAYTVQISDSIGCLGDMSDPFNFVSDVPEITGCDFGISVYPNPTDGRLNFTINNQNGRNVRVMLTNLLGEVIMTGDYNSQSINSYFDISNYANGAYVLIVDNGVKRYQQRIILQR